MSRSLLKKKQLTIGDFMHVIPEPEINQVMGKRLSKKFWKWMSGQTMSTYGVYPSDVERFLKGLPVID